MSGADGPVVGHAVAVRPPVVSGVLTPAEVTVVVLVVFALVLWGPMSRIALRLIRQVPDRRPRPAARVARWLLAAAFVGGAVWVALIPPLGRGPDATPARVREWLGATDGCSSIRRARPSDGYRRTMEGGRSALGREALGVDEISCYSYMGDLRDNAAVWRFADRGRALRTAARAARDGTPSCVRGPFAAVHGSGPALRDLCDAIEGRVVERGA